MYLEWTDSLTNEPTSKDSLDLGGAFVHIYLKHLFSLALYANEAIKETLSYVFCQDTLLITLKKEVKFGKAIKSSPYDKALQVLLHMSGRLMQVFDTLVLI
jgi:hypothetical protein